ncbi:MAG: Hsp70 family protein [Actinomycetota bacterium]|nr:Hsp70 family protein [Actinomycetota bacterium]
MWQLTVDLGASRTVASLAQDGAPAQLVQIDGASAVPSAVYLEQDGRLLVGLEAQRRAEHDPARYEPSPTLRIPETNLLLGEHLVPVVDAMAAVLGHIAGDLQQRLGDPPGQVLLTTPAYWGPAQAQALLQAATTVWGHGVQLLAGTQAAGDYCAAHSAMPPGRPFAVYDLGAGGLGCAVLVAGPHGVTTLASKGASGVGGHAVDAALMELVAQQVSGRAPQPWQALQQPGDLSARRVAFTMERNVARARERLSSSTIAALALPDPFGSVQLTRNELQELLRPQLAHTVAVLASTVADAQVAHGQLAGVFLLGGASRTPLVAELIGARFSVLGIIDDAATVLGAAHPSAPTATELAQSPMAPAAAVLPAATWQPYSAPAGGPSFAGADSSVQPAGKGGKQSKAPLVIAAAVAVLVLALVAGIAVIVAKSKSAPTDVTAEPATAVPTVAPSRSRRAAASSAPVPTTPSAPTSVPPPPPVVAGWQTVAVPNRGAAYDVPPGWKVSSQTTIGGYETKSSPPLVGKGLANFGDGFCDKYQSKALSVMTNSDQSDPAVGARELATKWATAAFSSDRTGAVPPLQIGPPQPLPAMAGKSGMLVEVTAPLEKPQDCSTPSASMYSFALPSSGGGTVGLMIYVGHGVPDAVTAGVVRQIASSVRPL